MSLIITVLFLFLPICSAQAGFLEDFEEDATNKHDSSASTKNSASNRISKECSFLASILFSCGNNVLNEPVSRKKGKKQTAFFKNNTPHRPYVRADLLLQKANSDVSAIGLESEISNGQIGLHLKLHDFEEAVPNDNLKFSQVHAMLTIYRDKFFHLDFGAGLASLDGKYKTKGYSLFLPTRINFNQSSGFEMYASMTELNGNFILDTRISLFKQFKDVSIIASYLTLKAPNETLHGPALGVSFSFK